MDKLLLIGPLPKDSASGVTLGFASLVEGCRSYGLVVVVVDLFSSGEPVKAGKFSATRVKQVLVPVFRALIGMTDTHRCYLTIGCSVPGFIRDAVLIWGARLLNKPIILHLKSAGYQEFYPSLGRRMQWFVRNTLGQAERIIALGESIRQQFDFVPNYNRRVVVVHNAAPSEVHYAAGGKCLPEAGKIHILYLSNMIASKGFGVVLECCRLLKDAGDERFHFHFCGGFGLDDSPGLDIPKTADDLNKWVEAKGISEFVTYHGVVRGEAKFLLLRKCHVFILPTKYPTEGQPISILEAMAGGLPVLATPWKGIVDQVVNGETGFFVNYEAPVEVMHRLLDLVRDQERFQWMSRQSVLRYKNRFSRHVHIENMIFYLQGGRDRIVSINII